MINGFPQNHRKYFMRKVLFFTRLAVLLNWFILFSDVNLALQQAARNVLMDDEHLLSKVTLLVKANNPSHTQNSEF